MRWKMNFRRASFGLALATVLMATAFVQAGAEPLRILIPAFKGKPVISRVISMTVYFNMIKALSGPNTAERGIWILYGEEEMQHASHKSAEAAASWPSVSADIAIWGKTTRVGKGFVVEPFITLSSISQKRRVRPDKLKAVFSTPEGRYDLSIASPVRFFDLEPFAVSADITERYGEYADGIAIYDSETATTPKAHTRDVVHFLEIKRNAARIRDSHNREGWIHLPELSRDNLTIVSFGHGMIQFLRGDWKDAIASFTDVNKFTDLPNALRIDTNLYLGISRYNLGQSGLADFRRAMALNAYDRNAARFLLLGYLLDYRRSHNSALLKSFDETMKRTRILFAKDNRWFQNLQQVARELRLGGTDNQ